MSFFTIIEDQPNKTLFFKALNDAIRDIIIGEEFWFEITFENYIKNK